MKFEYMDKNNIDYQIKNTSEKLLPLKYFKGFLHFSLFWEISFNSKKSYFIFSVLQIHQEVFSLYNLVSLN